MGCGAPWADRLSYLLDEVLAWMLAVPGIPPTSSRFGAYVCGYDVIGKIRQAKAAGTLEAVLNAPDRPAPFRLAAAIAAGHAQRARLQCA
jgi:hypothetical protein